MLALQRHQQHRQQYTAGNDRQIQVDIKQESQRNTHQGRVREGIAEISHAAPDYKGTQRACQCGNADAAGQCEDQKISHNDVHCIHPVADGQR